MIINIFFNRVSKEKSNILLIIELIQQYWHMGKLEVVKLILYLVIKVEEKNYRIKHKNEKKVYVNLFWLLLQINFCR
jgi:superoxide dismutase